MVFRPCFAYTKKMFFQKRLYFSCNQCGACCREFAIPLSHHDMLRLLAAHPELAPEALFRLRPAPPDDAEALLLEGETWHLLLQRAENACLFLDSDNRCGSYESRPQACRTFPFDPAPFGRVQILPAAELVWENRCDHDPVPKAMLRQARIDNHLGSEQFADYREVVSRWNAWATNAPERQHLADFLAFIRHLDALAPL